MKTKKIRQINLQVDIFKVDIILMIGDKDQLLPVLKDQLYPFGYGVIKESIESNPIGREDGLMFPIHGGGSVIWLKKYDLFVLVHELIHAVTNIMYEKNMLITKGSEEVLTYTVEYLLKESLKKIK